MELNEKNKLFLLNIFMIIIFCVNMLLFKKILINSIIVLSLIFTYKLFSESISEYLYFITILFALFGSAALFPISLTRGINCWYITLILYYIYHIFHWKDYIEKVKKMNLIKNKYSIFYIAFIVYAIGSLFFVKNLSYAFSMVKLFIFMIPLAVMFVVENLKHNNIKKTIKFLLYAFIAIITIGTIETTGFKFGISNYLVEYGKYKDDWNFYKRIPITFFYNQNNYAIFVVMGMIAIVLAYLYDKNKKHRKYYILLYFFSQLNLIFIASRVAISTLFITFVSMLIYSIITRDKVLSIHSIKALLLTCVILIVVSIFPAPQSYYGKFDTLPGLKYLNLRRNPYINKKLDFILNTSQDPQKEAVKVQKKEQENQDYERLEQEANMSSGVRSTIIKDVLKGIFVDKHYLGFGMGNTAEYLKSQNNTNKVLNAHSYWVEFLGDYGIFMFIYMTFIYISMFFRQLKINKSHESLKGISFGVAVLIFAFAFLSFGPSSVFGYTPFWMLIGMANATNYYSINEEIIES